MVAQGQHLRHDDRGGTPPPDAVELWAAARMAYFAGDFPQYASPEWLALPGDDPRRFAAALEAAEKWRKYGDEEALLQWFREAHQARPALADRRTRAELDTAVQRPTPRPLVPTPGWPPIAVPGQPGRCLAYPREKAA